MNNRHAKSGGTAGRRLSAGEPASPEEHQRIEKMLEESRQRVKPIVKSEREAERVTPTVANLRLK